MGVSGKEGEEPLDEWFDEMVIEGVDADITPAFRGVSLSRLRPVTGDNGADGVSNRSKSPHVLGFCVFSQTWQRLGSAKTNGHSRTRTPRRRQSLVDTWATRIEGLVYLWGVYLWRESRQRNGCG